MLTLDPTALTPSAVSNCSLALSSLITLHSAAAVGSSGTINAVATALNAMLHLRESVPANRALLLNALGVFAVAQQAQAVSEHNGTSFALDSLRFSVLRVSSVRRALGTNFSAPRTTSEAYNLLSAGGVRISSLSGAAGAGGVSATGCLTLAFFGGSGGSGSGGGVGGSSTILTRGFLGALSLEPAGRPRFLGAGGSIVSSFSAFSGNSSAFSDFSGFVGTISGASSAI